MLQHIYNMYQNQQKTIKVWYILIWCCYKRLFKRALHVLSLYYISNETNYWWSRTIYILKFQNKVENGSLYTHVRVISMLSYVCMCQPFVLVTQLRSIIKINVAYTAKVNEQSYTVYCFGCWYYTTMYYVFAIKKTTVWTYLYNKCVL